ncbi:hypothetical protein RchiOBHm_Chr4g0389101 [Rosa chinensis]|uniref:Uncharacterized protein n=1 Tax=Rosa chinensis TaxID=74649 RepID=A0A2P6QPW9_ROSCH|nr:hypothetical protein RchiOBHm_Chr4g0389101 [Rosa chinensis]
MEASVVPAFETSCKSMFEQVDATFQKAMVEHATVAQQQFESAHSPLAHAVRVCMLVLCPASSLLIIYLLTNILRLCFQELYVWGL